MKRKSLKACVYGFIFVLGASMLIGCSSNGSDNGSTGGRGNNVVIKDNYVINMKDEKYGLMDLDKKQIIPNKYKRISYVPSTDLLIVMEGEKYGVINLEGKEILPLEYKVVYAGDSYDKIYASDYKTTVVFDLNGKKEKTYDYGFVIDSEQGAKIVATDYNYTYEAVDDVYGTYVTTGKFGLLNDEGKEILKPEYDSASAFITERVDEKNKEFDYLSVYVEKDGKAGVFSLDGDVIIPMEYEAASQLDAWSKYYNISYNTYTQSYIVRKDDKYGAFDKNGKQIIETKFDNLRCSHNGYIATANENDTVFDLKGNTILSDTSLKVLDISDNGYIAVRSGNDTYYVDSKGKKVEMEGLKGLEVSYAGGFDKLGNAVITMNYNERALINEKGEFIIGPFTEEENTMLNIQKIGEINEDVEFRNLSNGWQAKKDYSLGSTDYIVSLRKPDKDNMYRIEKTSLYNRDGKKLADFDGAIDNNALTKDLYKTYIEIDDGWLYGLMDRSGKVIAEPIYDYIYDYDDYLLAEKGEKRFLLDKESGKVVLEY